MKRNRLLLVNIGVILMVGAQTTLAISCGQKYAVNTTVSDTTDNDYLDDIRETLRYIDSVFESKKPYVSSKTIEELDLDLSNEIVKDQLNLHNVLGVPHIDISNIPNNGTTVNWKVTKKIFPSAEYWLKIEVSKSSGTLSREYVILPEQSSQQDSLDIEKVKEQIKNITDEADKQSTLFYEYIESNIENAEIKDINNLASAFGCNEIDLSQINLYGTDVVWSAERGMNISSYKYWYNISITITKGGASDVLVFAVQSYANFDQVDVNLVIEEVKKVVNKVNGETSTKTREELAGLIGSVEYLNSQKEISDAIGISGANLGNIRLLETSIKWSISRKSEFEGKKFDVTIKVVKGQFEASHSFYIYSSEFFLHTRLKHEINRQVTEVITKTTTIVSKHDKAYFNRLIRSSSISLEVNDIAQVIGIDDMNFSHIKSDPKDKTPYLGAIIQNYSETVTDVYTLSFHAVESNPSNPAVYRSTRIRILPSDIEQDKRDIIEYLHKVQNKIMAFDGYSTLTPIEINQRYNDPEIIRNETNLHQVFGVDEFNISSIEKNGVTPGTWVKSEYNGPNDHNYTIRVEASKNGYVFGTQIIRKYI